MSPTTVAVLWMGFWIVAITVWSVREFIRDEFN